MQHIKNIKYKEPAEHFAKERRLRRVPDIMSVRMQDILTVGNQSCENK